MGLQMSEAHMWGDPTHDWEGLLDAMKRIDTRCKDELGITIQIKEKYGSIRYEFIELWKSPLTKEDIRNVKLIVLQTALEFPHLADEIIEDFYDTFED